jgi:hypothetical protein
VILLLGECPKSRIIAVLVLLVRITATVIIPTPDGATTLAANFVRPPHSSKTGARVAPTELKFLLLPVSNIAS